MYYTGKRKDFEKHDSSQIFEGLLCRRKVKFILCSYWVELGPGVKQMEVSGWHVSVYL